MKLYDWPQFEEVSQGFICLTSEWTTYTRIKLIQKLFKTLHRFIFSI